MKGGHAMTIDPKNVRFRPELVDPSAYIAPGAVVLGNVTLRIASGSEP
jgi:hypothetical protein